MAGFANFFGGNKSADQGNGNSQGGNGDGNNQNNGNNGNNGNNANGGNNDSNPKDFTAGLWDAPNDNKGNNNGGGNNDNGNNNNNNNNGGKQTNPVTAFDDYVKGLDFGVKFDKEHTEKLANGDMSVLPDMFQNIMQATYKRAMMDVNQLVAAKVGEAVDTAVTKANGARGIDKLVDNMNSQLEFTKDPLIAPVAKTILGRAIGKGLSHEDAITAVRQYFGKVAGAAGDLADGGNKNNNNSRRFGNQSGGDLDFIAMLSGQDQD